MNFFTRFSLKNSVAVLILAALMIIAGLFSFQNLKVDLLPDIEFPQLSIEIVYPGASPQDVEEQVTRPLESKLENIDKLSTLKSSSYESTAIINLEFPFATNIESAKQEVEGVIQEVDVPVEAKINVNSFSFGSFPIYSISLFAKDGTDLEKVYIEEIQPALSKVSGVGSVSVGGETNEILMITVDRAKAARAGLTLQQIQEAIKGKFISFPAGTITSDKIEVPVRVEEKVKSIKELESLTFPVQSNGAEKDMPTSEQIKPATLTLGEIAKIEASSEQTEITRFNEKSSLMVAVTKKQDANTVEVSDQVLEVLDQYSGQVEYAIGFDQASGIKESVFTLIREGLLGALFASLAVLIFLRNIRATLIAITSIPLSLIMTAIFLDQQNITLNIMTLGGMAVAVGRVVDDSIVVIENIFRRNRMRATGEDKNELIADATREVLKAIVSSTITTAVVFLPLAFVGGITGEFFRPFAYTVVAALAASLLVSVTLVPIFGRFSFAKEEKEEKDGRLQVGYLRIIRSLLNHKKWVIAGSLLLLIGSLALVPTLGFTFLPNEEQKTIVGSVELPSSTPLERSNQISMELESLFSERQQIESVTTGVGARDYTTGLQRENTIEYFIGLKDEADIEKEIAELDSRIEEILAKFSKESVVSLQELEAGGPPTNTNVDINLYSSDLDALQVAAANVETYMEGLEEIEDIQNNLQDKQTQWVVELDAKETSRLGISNGMVLGLVADRTRPSNLEEFTIDGEEKRLRIQYNEQVKEKGELEQIMLPSSKGMVPLKEVAKVKEVKRVTSIQKLDGNVYAQVTGQVRGDNVQQVSQSIIQKVEDEVNLPDNVSLDAGSGSEETVKTFRELGLAMIVAIGLVYLTMLITFGEARIPFIVLSSLIFVPVGAIGGLFLTGEPLSVSAMIGLLMLIGIVTTNAIVLVDRIGQNRDKGMAIREALMEAGKTRLRPILMTAFATIAALLPLAFTTSSGTLISKSLAVVVIGGLTTSTLLTLVIIPVIYELFYFRQVRKEQGK
ncbi:efflux RND transporter permease subunit [Mechercharimyces sp. CAU 1602]|uniref:efflux RND transporter permease subunit n=1 Tax=Mechercharimyces sp. CAU 1602 TaxID=2973933 RepID=UPI00216352F4|nr:efflux RND transporter permease subunit [Mechercharimyces sp. CAU 1602]MCS1351848.1 efflux RND transporter permease subunit [Mechercharimyces sp. CAU 1602]